MSSGNLNSLSSSPGLHVMKLLPSGIVQTINQPQRTGTPPPFIGGQTILVSSASSTTIPATQPLYPSGTKITIGGPGEGMRVVTPGGTASKMLANAQGLPANGSVQTPPHPTLLTDKDVTRMWANEDMSLRKLQQQVSMVSAI